MITMIKILLWPFFLLWAFIGFLFQLMGRVVAAAVGLALLTVGVVLTVTVIGAVVGIPLLTLGILLVVRAIF